MTPFFSHVQQSVAERPSSPLVTWIDQSGRIELSVITFANGVSKAANLLRDQCEIGPGSSVCIDLPTHWQSSVWIAATLSVEAGVSLDTDESDLLITSETSKSHSQHEETGIVSLHPFGMPVQLDDPFLINLSADVRMHGDRFSPREQAASNEVCMRDPRGQLIWADFDARVAELADQYGIESGTRYAVTQSAQSIDLALLYCAVPLMTGSSVVLLDQLDTDAVHQAMVQENCTSLITL